MRLPLCNNVEESKHCHFSCYPSLLPWLISGYVAYLELRAHARIFGMKFCPVLALSPLLQHLYQIFLVKFPVS